MFGKMSGEAVINAVAERAWQIFGTLELTKVVLGQDPKVVDKIEVLQGDGSEGTVIKLTSGSSSYTEKFTKVDNENRVKVAQGIEGGLLDYGFSLYRVIFEISEKDKECSILKFTIEYEAKDEETAKLADLQSLIDVANAVNQYLINNP